MWISFYCRKLYLCDRFIYFGYLIKFVRILSKISVRATALRRNSAGLEHVAPARVQITHHILIGFVSRVFCDIHTEMRRSISNWTGDTCFDLFYLVLRSLALFRVDLDSNFIAQIKIFLCFYISNVVLKLK